MKFISGLQGHGKKSLTNPLLEPPNEFNYRLAYNEDSLDQALAWRSTLHTLEIVKTNQIVDYC